MTNKLPINVLDLLPRITQLTSESRRLIPATV